MFRRKRSSSNPPRPGSTTPNAAAALAASQAFLANKASNANLSASAAAAALRSHTSTPINVGQVQTRRMQRRGSTSSNGSASRPSGSLQRRGSGDSMTQRSFRETSPHRPTDRPASSHGPYPKYEIDAPPPVPALPHRYASPSPPSSAAVTRVANTQPKTQHKEAQLTSRTIIDPPAAPKASNPQKRPPVLDAKDVAHLAANKADHRASINFSRPMSPQNVSSQMSSFRVKSPPPGPPVTAVAPPEKTNSTAPTVRDDTAGPVKKKKKKKSMVNEPIAMQDATYVAQSRTPRVQNNSKQDVTRSSEMDESFGSSYPSDTESVVSDVSSTTDFSRVGSARPRGLLAKQPSIVREDREGEEKAETQSPPPSSMPKAKSNDLRKSAIAKETKKSTAISVTQQAAAEQSKAPKSRSVESLSPSRALHFSKEPMYNTPESAKHEPLGRSASPAKSAMKQPPSRGQSPSLLRSKGLNVSEASDTASGMSDDGSQTRKKKKHARVSFDADSVMVGEAASPVTTDSPVLMSPQDKVKVEHRLAQNASTGTEDRKSDHQGEEFTMEPTPVLPSFGSVRGRKESEKRSEAHGEQVNDDSQGSAAAPPQPGDGVTSLEPAQEPVERDVLGSESDTVSPHTSAVYDANGAKAENEVAPSNEPVMIGRPLSSNAGKELQQPSSNVASNSTPETSTDHNVEKDLEGLVPSIAVLPATPAADGERTKDEGWLGMPGGFPGNTDVSGGDNTKTKVDAAPGGQAATNQRAASNQVDNASHPISENTEPSLHAAGLPVRAEARPKSDKEVFTQDQTTSTNLSGGDQPSQIVAHQHTSETNADEDSVYSDAAEDQSDPAGDGFGSINAIVERPSENDKEESSVSTASPTDVNVRSDGNRASPIEPSSPITGSGQKDAQAYWSGLSPARRQQLEHAALPGAVDEPIIANKTLRGKSSIAKKPKKRPAKQVGMTGPQQAGPDAKSNVKSGMPRSVPGRGEYQNRPESVVSGPTKINPRPSAPRQPSINENKGVLQKKNRPISAAATTDHRPAKSIAPPKSTQTTSTRSSMPPGSVASQAHKAKDKSKPKLNRSRSNGSDSSSSFKRTRSANPNSGRYQMKRSMRANRPETAEAAIGNRNRLSTPGNSAPSSSATRRPFSHVGADGPGMRMSMRQAPEPRQKNVKPARYSLDSSKLERAKSPSRLSFTFGSKTKQVKRASKKESPFSSRFKDSSDEEDGAVDWMRSRFEDSSDSDNEPTELTPVRGIPRKIDEGDSTDLDDSSVETARAPNSGKSNDTQPTSVSSPSTKAIGSALTAGSMRTANDKPAPGAEPQGSPSLPIEQEKKKRSFFGSLARKRKDDQSAYRNSIVAQSHDSKESQRQSDKRDPVHLSGEAEAAKSPIASPVKTGVQSPADSPGTENRDNPVDAAHSSGDTWTLGPSADSKGKPQDRPKTSDGRPAPTNSRPTTGGRRVTSQSYPEPMSIAGSGNKKKRFPMLRKALGLNK